MSNIFALNDFQFPYNYKFPGQATNEQILFVTRENKLMLRLRQAIVLIAAVAVAVSGFLLAGLISSIVGGGIASLIGIISLVLAVIFLLIGWWWVSTLWKKSLMIVTNKRLTKFIYTTPASRHSLTLPLEMIVDTGAYSKGFIQSFLNLGTFTARSSAASSGVATDNHERINKKYFYIQNVAFAEDLQQYINKLLSEFRTAATNKLEGYRPFIPHLKGEARKEFLRQNYPQYL